MATTSRPGSSTHRSTSMETAISMEVFGHSKTTTVLVRRERDVSYARIKWWGTADPATVRSAVKGAMEMQDVYLIDESSKEPVEVDELKEGTKLMAFDEPPSTPRKTLIETLRELGTVIFQFARSDQEGPLAESSRRFSNDWQDSYFQKQLLKFERIISHLASERTTLAWVRCSLLMLAQAIQIWRLRNRTSSTRLKGYFGATGALYFCFIPLMFAVSMTRHVKMQRTVPLSLF